MDILIRKAELTDASLLATLGAQTFHDAFAAYNKEEDMAAYMQANFTEEKLLKEMRAPKAEFYIAYKEGEALGFAKTGEKEPPAGIAQYTCRELERIYVLKNYQSLKVGEQLLNHCIKKAKEDKIAVLWLGVWEHNPRAIAFYRRFGFEHFSEHVFMLGSDAQTDWLMMRKLR